MKPRYSDSLMLVWQFADLEAKHLQAAFLEPAHLLLGLCKCVDINIPISRSVHKREVLLEELRREFRRLREAFECAGFDARLFRRRYRSVLPEGSARLSPTVTRLHRNDAARDAFVEAETFATVSGGVMHPIHLLYSLLTEEDSQRKKAMAAVGSNEAILRKSVKRELFPQVLSTPGRFSPQWN